MADVEDISAQFATAWQRAKEYPLTVLRTEVFGHTLKCLQERLGQDGLFRPSSKMLAVRDLQVTATKFDRGRFLKSVDDVEALRDPEEKDPWWRFIFLRAHSSRDSLGCSREQLAMLLTYHQVMPSFLDLVFTFRARSRPLNYAIFRQENYLDKNAPSLPLPHLGRSGIQVQHAFNLLTVEKSDQAQERNQWPLRHAALYHSLDLQTGRAVYILLKGDSGLASRIKHATETNRHLRPDSPRTAEQSFIASLQVHLIMLEWSVENWSEYIDSMEGTLRSRSVEAKVAPVATVTSPVNLAQSLQRRGSSFPPRGPSRTFSRQGTVHTLTSQPATMSRDNSNPQGMLREQPSEPKTPSSPTSPASPASSRFPLPPIQTVSRRTSSSGFPTRAVRRTLSGIVRRVSGGLENGAASIQQQEAAEGEEESDEVISQLAELENRFSFNELQRLSLTADEINRSILALEQSRDVIVQVQDQYRAVTSSRAFKKLLDGNKCKTEAAVFFRRVSRILHDMEVHRRRLLDLARTAENDKYMFESLNQHTSIQTSKAFQLVAHTSSEQMMQWTLKMHEIAVKTKKETLSMHVITIFTLIFLPGTFIATLFSSGVLRWDEDGTLGSDWVVRRDGIRLFLSICLPLTVVTVSIWAAVYGAARRWARRHGRDVGLPGYADERGIVVAAGPQQQATPRDENRPPRRTSAMAAVTNPDPFFRFSEFVNEAKSKHVGHDIAGNAKPYVPLSALSEYWTPHRISSVLRAIPGRLNVDPGLIRSSYLRIFSTLVYTGPDTVGSLTNLFISRNLDDDCFPRHTRPNEWPDEAFFCKFFDSIAPHQWQFFPLPFHPHKLHDRHLHKEYILPIDPVTEIDHSSAASIQRFDIHAEYNDLSPKDEHGRPTRSTFVLKIYHGRKHEASYENEYRVLDQHRRNRSPNVVELYGSFRQLESYCLILEYANAGNLGEYFENCQPPRTVEDVAAFWKSLFQVFQGLERIHQLMLYDGEEYIKGIHEDIRPENILLIKGLSPYHFVPKLADFGLYSRVRTVKSRSSGSGFGLDRYGNQRFSKWPRALRHKGINMITTLADIFSAGAILSHAAAWVIGGRGEQQRYFEQRKAYHDKNHSLFKHSGYEGCFHDSIQPIPVVAQHHQSFLRRLMPGDDVTPKVIELIERFMLRQSNDRLPARDLHERFEQFLAIRSLASPSSLTPSTTATTDATPQSSCWSVQVAASPSTTNGRIISPPADPPSTAAANPDPNTRPALRVLVTSHDDGTTAPTVPTAEPTARASAPPSPVSPATTPGSQIGVSEIHQYRSDVRQGRPADPRTAQLIEYLEHNLSGRDQFFFVDDSRSMGQLGRKTIADGFQALACLAKRLDPNRVELAFASQPRRVYRARHTSDLHQRVADCAYKGDGGLMEAHLGDLVDYKIIPRLPYRLLGFNINLRARHKVSIYVLTDGNWGPADCGGDACGVERPVRRLIEELRKRGLDRTQVSLHFIRFGNKENGRKHLERLDDFGRQDGWDIVDVKHIESDVASMIIGPLSRANDDIQAI
ncbi:hypothetical protein L209DRAFT_682575 [Thermothelomyces heterothallicus CBS 203.75]